MADQGQKRRQERLMAEGLVKALRLQVRSIESRDPPNTDITLVLTSGGAIALEVRGLTDPMRQESISTRLRVGKMVEAELGAGFAVKAHVAWEAGALVRTQDAYAVAKAMARCIREMVASGRSNVGELEPIPNQLAGLVAEISLFPSEGQRSSVRTSQEAWEGTGTPDVVQRALDEKQEKLESYRLAHPGQEVWLVLWTSAGESQPVAPGMLDAAHTFRSAFDRVFVLDYPRKEAMELKISPGGRPG